MRHLSGTECLCPPHLYAEAITPNVIRLAGGVSGRQLGLEEVVRVAPPGWDQGEQAWRLRKWASATREFAVRLHWLGLRLWPDH